MYQSPISRCQSYRKFMQKENLYQQIEKQQKEIAFLQKHIKQERSKVKQQEQEIIYLQSELAKAKVEKAGGGEQSFNERKQQDLQFYEQEVKILKSQLLQLENLNKKISNELEKARDIEQDKVREQYFKDREEKLMIEMKELVELKNDLHLQVEAFNDSMKQQQSNFQSVQEEKELLQNELRSLQRKYESLAQEKLNLQIKQEILDRSSERSSPEKETPDKEEVRKLKAHIDKLEQTIKSLRIAYEQDMKIKNEGKFKQPSERNNQEVVFLQKLANSLAETLTEKETALENSKNINKDLMKKIYDLEKLLKDR